MSTFVPITFADNRLTVRSNASVFPLRPSTDFFGRKLDYSAAAAPAPWRDRAIAGFPGA
jgi:hypothetical protein